MSEDIYSQFLRFTVAESAASTLTEGTAILTGASVNRVAGKNIALEIHAIAVQMSYPADSPAAGIVETVTCALSTRSGLTSMPLMSDEHCIYLNQRAIRAGVAVYLPLVESTDLYMPSYIEFKHPLLVSHPKIYPYIQSSNVAALAAMFGVIVFTYVLLDADLAIEALESFR